MTDLCIPIIYCDDLYKVYLDLHDNPISVEYFPNCGVSHSETLKDLPSEVRQILENRLIKRHVKSTQP